MHTLIYNAGGGMFKPFDQTTREEFDQVLLSNSGGLFSFAQELLPGMVGLANELTKAEKVVVDDV